MYGETNLLALAAAVLLLATSSLAQMTLNPSASAPSGASPTVNPAFAAFAFEERSFFSYSNFTLSQNLMAQSASRTNSRPAVRVGGNSLNTATYVTDSSTSIIIPASQQNRSIPNSVTLGPAFWSCFKNFPDAQYIVDVPMNNFGGNAGSDTTTTTRMAQDVWDTIGSDNILAFELGNEPNSYNNYDLSDYATQFQQYSSAISKALNVSNTDQIYLAGGLSSPAVGQWNASNMWSSGLSSVTSRIATFAPHFYQLQSREVVNLQNLLSHNTMVNRVAVYVPQIKYVNSLTPSVPFDFGETACGLGQIQDPSYVLERSLGAALWQVDFMLYTMTLGVNRVHMQSGYGFEFSLWQPSEFNNQPAEVYANYYAQLFVGDFIGSSGKMQAVQVDTGGSDTLTAYAAYEAGTLKRVAITNLGYYDGTQANRGQRATQTFTIAVPSSVSSVTVQTLTAPNGAVETDTANITWAGMKYTLENDGMAQSVGNASSVLQVTNGHVTVSLAASQAVMVFFGAHDTASGTTSLLSSSMSTTSASKTSSTAAARTSSTGGAVSAVSTGSVTASGATATATHKSAASGSRNCTMAVMYYAALALVVVALANF